MSAQRRREVITRFSIPVKGAGSSRLHSRSSRGTWDRRKGKARQIDDEFDYNDDSDADFLEEDHMDDDDDAEEVNPRVMLISLRAVSPQGSTDRFVAEEIPGCSWSQSYW